MTDRPDKPRPAASAKGKRREAERKQKQAELLRRNLLKRKAQTRGRRDEGEDGGGD
jgi:hypothetical protein